MANVRAFRAGNWSDTSTSTSPWATGGTLYAPAATDVVYSNSFTIQVDTTTVTGLTVTNAASASILFKDGATTTATAGGSFNLNTSGVTLNAAINAGTANCVTCSLNSPSTITINGNIAGSTTTNSASGVNYSSGSGAMTITGNITGGSAAAGSGINGVSYAGTGSLTITGSLTGGTGSAGNNFAVNSTSTGTVNITGAIIGGANNTSNSGFRLSGNGTVTINGNIAGYAAAAAGGPGVELQGGTGSITITGAITAGNFSNVVGVVNSSTAAGSLITINGNATGGSSGTNGAVNASQAGNVTINGNVTGGSGSNTYGAYNTGTGTLIINGTVTGGTSSNGYGAANTSTGVLTVNGTSAASDLCDGSLNNGTGTLNVTRAKANSYGVGTTGRNAAYGLTNNSQSICTVKEIEYGTLGMAPTRGIVLLTDVSTNVAVFYKTNGTLKTLTDPNTSSVFPAASDVRFGTTYNSGSLTGTLRVPAAGSVALGVSVDNTTGTAVLTQSNVWDYSLASASATSGSVGEKLKKVANTSDIIALG